MLDYTVVSREFRSLIHRRKDLFLFLGSLFAASGLFLRNVLQHNLPQGLVELEQYSFTFYALMLMVPSLIVALRLAKLHGGIIINGILYARLMEEQSFTRKHDHTKAGRHNFFGVSFLQFLLASILAAYSSAILTLASVRTASVQALAIAAAVGVSVLLFCLLYYLFNHERAAAFGRARAASEPCVPFSKNEWEEHVSSSLEQSNEGLLSEISFTGLILFSVFEMLSGLPGAQSDGAELAARDVQEWGPYVYGSLLLITCLLELMIYIRLRIAIGHFCLQLNPNDRPFTPLRVTDSLLGYVLLAFFFVVSFHLMALMQIPWFKQHQHWLFLVDGVILLVLIAAEQIALIVAGRWARQIA